MQYMTISAINQFLAYNKFNTFLKNLFYDHRSK